MSKISQVKKTLLLGRFCLLKSKNVLPEVLIVMEEIGEPIQMKSRFKDDNIFFRNLTNLIRVYFFDVTMRLKRFGVSPVACIRIFLSQKLNFHVRNLVMSV